MDIRDSFSLTCKRPEGVESFFNFIKSGSLDLVGRVSPQVLLAAFAHDFPTGDIEGETMERMAKLAGPVGLESKDICLPVDPYEIANVLPTFNVNEVDFKNSPLSGVMVLNHLKLKKCQKENSLVPRISFLIQSSEQEHKKKYILAHMMGHYFLNHAIIAGKAQVRFIENERTLGYGICADTMEYEADTFALDLMVPKKVLEEILNEGSFSVLQMLEIFDVPLDMLVRQAERIGRRLPCFGVVDAGPEPDHLFIDI